MFIKCLFLLIILTVISSFFACGPVVTFPDPNLEAVIRETIDKPEGPIHTSDLKGLTSLSTDGGFSDKGSTERIITDITGLEYCTNLTDLDLVGNQISDISPLANLTNLTGISLANNQISDISPLANLTNLDSLRLKDNQISDISPLANLINLTGIGLANNQISDISPLANLTNLTGIGLANNQISDISPLANLTNLRWLELQGNPISDISPLVVNRGLSKGDYITFPYDNLDMSVGSENVEHIRALKNRGIGGVPLIK